MSPRIMRVTVSASAAGQGNHYALVGRDPDAIRVRPGRGAGEFFARHVQRVDLPPEDSDHLDGDADAAPSPAEDPAVIYDEHNLSLLRTRYLAHETDRGVAIIEYR